MDFKLAFELDHPPDKAAMMRTKFWHDPRIDHAILSWPAYCARWKLEHARFALQITIFIVPTDTV